MIRTIPFVIFLFVLATFQFSLANSNIVDVSSEQTFSTPEQTWNLFKTSILSSDYAMAKKCCRAGEIKRVLKFEKMDAEKRKSIVQSMQSIKKIEMQENTAKYEIVREINGVSFSTFVYFEKVDDGWKIARY